MTIRYLLDSTLLIDHFNGVPKAAEFLKAHIEACAISVVTLAEVLYQPANPENAAGLALLESLPVIPVETPDAALAAEYRRNYKLKPPDAFQAALAVRHGLRLVTRNTKDFDPKKHSFVHVPYKI